jgi:hypothetical protein
MRLAFKVDVSQVGLDEMREYPELVPACGELCDPATCDSDDQAKLTVRLGGSACLYECLLFPPQAEFPVMVKWMCTGGGKMDIPGRASLRLMRTTKSRGFPSFIRTARTPTEV